MELTSEKSPQQMPTAPGRRDELLAAAMKFLAGNAVVLVAYCGLWYWGYYLSKYWMRVIDLGAPWSWLAALFATSYSVSYFAFRYHSGKVLKSLIGPFVTLPIVGFGSIFAA
jgi:hypothetical protein